MDTLTTKPPSRILSDIHALLLASNVKVHSKGQTLSFRGLVGETRIDVSLGDGKTPDGARVYEIIRIESVVDMRIPTEMECVLNMQASTGALVAENDGKFRIKSRFPLYAGETEEAIRDYAGLLFFVAVTHTDALQAAVVDALQLPVSKATPLDSATDRRWEPASFIRAAVMLKESGAFANGDASGLTAEFPWDSGAFSAGLDSLATGPTKRTSLLQIQREEHPNLGKGLFCRLDLPLQLEESEAFKLAMSLNRMESAAGDWPPFLGAWTSRSGSGRPTFVSFWSDSFANAISVERIATWMANRATRLPVLLGNGGMVIDTVDSVVHKFSSQSRVDGVAAAPCQPLGTSAIEVKRNSGGPPSSTATVHFGISAAYHEAFQQAAKEAGVQPRQMQSGTWAGLYHASSDTRKRANARVSDKSDVERRSESANLKSVPSRVPVSSRNRAVNKEGSNATAGARNSKSKLGYFAIVCLVLLGLFALDHTGLLGKVSSANPRSGQITAEPGDRYAWQRVYADYRAVEAETNSQDWEGFRAEYLSRQPQFDDLRLQCAKLQRELAEKQAPGKQNACDELATAKFFPALDAYITNRDHFFSFLRSSPAKTSANVNVLKGLLPEQNEATARMAEYVAERDAKGCKEP